MLKIIPPDSQDFGEPVVRLLKVAVSKSGMLRKDASIDKLDDALYAALEKSPPKSGEVPVHLIALGSGEYFGCNRNGDYFPEKSCIKYVDTFVKHARFYRNHKHNDPKQSYGIVKAAVYNNAAHRIELLVYLNGTKEAAARNEGLVADKELDKLYSDKPIGVSMSCRVPYDVCSGCGNKARSRSEYCDSNSCIKYGGLKNNIGRTFDDGHTLCAINEICDWFDISHVHQPADRIAWVLGLVKQGADRILSGAELADLVMLEPSARYIALRTANNDMVNRQLSALDKLDLYQKNLQTTKNAANKILYNAARCRILELSETDWSEPGKIEQLLSATTKHGCVLHPNQFAALLKYGDFRYALGGVFDRLKKKPNLHELLATNPFVIDVPADCDGYIEKQAAGKSIIVISPYWLLQRPVETDMIKLAKSEMPDIADKLADLYGLYQIALLARFVDHPNANSAAALLVAMQRV